MSDQDDSSREPPMLRWIYSDLYMIEERVAVLKRLVIPETCPLVYPVRDFLGLVVQSFWNDIVMSVGRLCDSANSGNRRNASVEALLMHASVAASNEIYTSWVSAKHQAQQIITFRNRAIAHSCAAAAEGETALRFAVGEESRIAEAVREVLVDIANREGWRPPMPHVGHLSGVSNLLRDLRAARRLEILELRLSNKYSRGERYTHSDIHRMLDDWEHARQSGDELNELPWAEDARNHFFK
jgi:hypothetical protein